jgi:hypothetical protein
MRNLLCREDSTRFRPRSLSRAWLVLHLKTLLMRKKWLRGPGFLAFMSFWILKSRFTRLPVEKFSRVPGQCGECRCWRWPCLFVSKDHRDLAELPRFFWSLPLPQELVHESREEVPGLVISGQPAPEAQMGAPNQEEGAPRSRRSPGGHSQRWAWNAQEIVYPPSVQGGLQFIQSLFTVNSASFLKIVFMHICLSLGLPVPCCPRKQCKPHAPFQDA